MSKTMRCVESVRKSVQRMSDEVGAISLAVSEGRITAKVLDDRLVRVQEILGDSSDTLADLVRQMKEASE